MIVTTTYGSHEPTEFNNVISFYPSITQSMVDSHRETTWDKNSGAYLGHHPAEDYGTSECVPNKQLIIAHQRLISNILSL